MSWLLDTKVVSEWTKPRPNEAVVSWMAAADEDRTFLSVIVLAKLRRGVEARAPGRRRETLERWLADELKPRFAGRILPVDERAAELWATIRARAQARGVQLGIMDAFVAATAEANGLTVVTRDVRDFRAARVAALDPSQG